MIQYMASKISFSSKELITCTAFLVRVSHDDNNNDNDDNDYKNNYNFHLQ